MTNAKDLSFTYFTGLFTTMSSAPLIHPFNAIAAASARSQETSLVAAKHIYAGMGVHSDKKASLKNFENGITGHLAKEFVRSFGRIGGVVILDPYFKQRFSEAAAPYLIALVMSCYEICFANAADVWKSNRAVGRPTAMADIWKGSLGNGVRQGLMWFVWSKSIAPIQRFFKKNNVDPNSNGAIVARSFMQGMLCTTVTYPSEMLLRTLQVRSGDYEMKNFSVTANFLGKLLTGKAGLAGSTYYQVTRDLVSKFGVRGMMLGFGAKAIGNSILLTNANFMAPLQGWIRKRFNF